MSAKVREPDPLPLRYFMIVGGSCHIHRSLHWRLRQASIASKRELGPLWMRASSCRWPTNDAPRSAQRRRHVLLPRDEGPERRFRPRCPERSDAWAMRDADRPRACPTRLGGTRRWSDRCSLPEPDWRDRAHSPRAHLQSVPGIRSPAPMLSRHRQAPAKAD